MKFYFNSAFSLLFLWFIQDICTILLSILIKNGLLEESNSNTILLLYIQKFRRKKSEYL